MTWNASTEPGKGARAAIMVLLIWASAACTPQQAGDVVLKAIEGTARAACDNAGNCQNSCPDGSAARGPFYRCP